VDSGRNLWGKVKTSNRSARFIDAYSQGLSGPEAAWANRKYHGHRTLPPTIAADLKNSYKEYLTKIEALKHPVFSKIYIYIY